MYWYDIWLCPETKRFPDPKEAGQAVRDFAPRFIRSPRFWLTFALLMAALILLTPLAAPYVNWLARGRFWFVALFVFGPFQIVACGALFIRVGRTPLRRYLRGRLLEIGVPVCTACGYDLRGQTVARCPECGHAFDLNLLKGSAKRKPESAQPGSRRPP
jgi:hypothetical protein